MKLNELRQQKKKDGEKKSKRPDFWVHTKKSKRTQTKPAISSKLPEIQAIMQSMHCVASIPLPLLFLREDILLLFCCFVLFLLWFGSQGKQRKENKIGPISSQAQISPHLRLRLATDGLRPRGTPNRVESDTKFCSIDFIGRRN